MKKQDKKYKLTSKTTKVAGRTLYRIKALRSFESVKKGELGGFIEKEENLSHRGACWVSDSAQVYGNAKVSGNAKVYGNARVYGNSTVTGDARVVENARVTESAWVDGNAWVTRNALVTGDAVVTGDALVTKDAWVAGNAQVTGTAKLTRKSLTCNAGIHSITITDTHIRVGCITRTKKYWAENVDKIGEENGYTDAQIKAFKYLIDSMLFLEAESDKKN